MKNVMSGQRIPFFHRMLSFLDIYRAYRAGLLGDAASEIKFHNDLLDIYRKHTGIEISQAKILDIGCGQTAVQTILFKADGADVTGIDLEIPTYEIDLAKFIRILRKNGMERAVKSLARHLLFDKRFFSELFSGYGKNIPLNELDIRIMNATDLSFPDNHFDFIYSAWVFQHMDNVDGVVREISRVLKHSGTAWIGIHLFPSVSGSHHMEWSEPDKSPSKKVPLWDHLLENQYPVNAYLNKLRLNEFREIFNKYVEVIEEKFIYEGEKLLTPALEAVLLSKGYTRQELLTRVVVFILKKK
ncbi:MAG: class I SAM-dependent methyltransferase [Thermodesulfovibrionia bacterium]|nr:class I SAM-dependent methyltransferase [Thermodesulfovibrionia bacterium]